MSSLQVGVAQVDTRLGQNQANLDKHLDYIERARREGVQLLVFPETSLSGFPHGAPHENALRLNGASVSQLAKAAGEMIVVVGVIEEAKAAQFYNTSVVLKGGK